MHSFVSCLMHSAFATNEGPQLIPDYSGAHGTCLRHTLEFKNSGVPLDAGPLSRWFGF